MATRKNLCVQPNFELGSGWTAVGTHETVTYSTEHVHEGSKALKVVTAGSEEFEGAAAGPFVPTIASSQPYILSIWVFAEGTAVGKKLILEVSERTSGGAFIRHDESVITLASGWNRFSMTATTASTAAELEFFTRWSSASGKVAATYWVDSILVETGSTLNPYFDGSTTLEGFTTSWEGTVNNSVSKAEEAAAVSPHNLTLLGVGS